MLFQGPHQLAWNSRRWLRSSVGEVAGVERWRRWDVASHRQVGPPLTGHTDAVASVAFSPDRKTLATSSDDMSIRLWNVPQLGDPAAFLCRSVGQALTGDRWQTLVPAGTKYRPLCP